MRDEEREILEVLDRSIYTVEVHTATNNNNVSSRRCLIWPMFAVQMTPIAKHGTEDTKLGRAQPEE